MTDETQKDEQAPDLQEQAAPADTATPPAETTIAPAEGDPPASEIVAEPDLATESAAPAISTTVVDTTAVPVTEPTAPVEEAAAPVVTASTQPAISSDASLSEEEQYLAEVRQTGTDEQKAILAALESFCETTQPGKILTPQIFTNAQFVLFSHLMTALNLEHTAFKGAWNVALVFFAARHGDSKTKSAISERFCNRYPYAWTRGQEKLSALMNLFALLRGTRDRKTRNIKAKTFMLEKVGPGVLSQQALQNLQKFYG